MLGQASGTGPDDLVAKTVIVRGAEADWWVRCLSFPAPSLGARNPLAECLHSQQGNEQVYVGRLHLFTGAIRSLDYVLSCRCDTHHRWSGA